MKITACAVRLLCAGVAQAAVIQPGSTLALTSADKTQGYRVFGKRHVLEERDYDLAEKHGVDLNDMRKHSVIKRDGEEITFWVNKAFTTENEVKIERRDTLETTADAAPPRRERMGQFMRAIDAPDGVYRPNFTPDPFKAWYCGEALEVEEVTDEDSPSVKTMSEVLVWAKFNPGRFQVFGACCEEPVPLIIAGSNDGTNAALKVKQNDRDFNFEFKLGTQDIEEIVKKSILKVNKDYYTAWELIGSQLQPDFRMATRGGLRCKTITPGFRRPSSPWVEWQLAHYKNVPALAKTTFTRSKLPKAQATDKPPVVMMVGMERNVTVTPVVQTTTQLSTVVSTAVSTVYLSAPQSTSLVYPPGWDKFNQTTPSAQTPSSTRRTISLATGMVYPPGWQVNKTAVLVTPGSFTPTPMRTSVATGMVYPPGYDRFNQTTPRVLTPSPFPQSARTASGTVYPPGWKYNGTAALTTPGFAATPTPQTTKSAGSLVYPPGWKLNETVVLMTTPESVTPTSQGIRVDTSIVYPPGWKSNVTTVFTTPGMTTPSPKTVKSASGVVYPPNYHGRHTPVSPSALTPQSTPEPSLWIVKSESSIVYSPYNSESRTPTETPESVSTPTTQVGRSASGTVFPPGYDGYDHASPAQTPAATRIASEIQVSSSSTTEKTNSTVTVYRSASTLPPVIKVLNGEMLVPVFWTATPTISTPATPSPTTRDSGLEWVLHQLF